MNSDETKLLTLVDEKRCDQKLLDGLTKFFFDESISVDSNMDCVKVFDKLSDLEKWKNKQAIDSKTKYIFIFYWQWRSKKDKDINDIVIGDFSRQWNPEDTDEQVIWLNGNEDDRVAGIYISLSRS